MMSFKPRLYLESLTSKIVSMKVICHIQIIHSGDHRCSRDKPRPDRGHRQESRGLCELRPGVRQGMQRHGRHYPHLPRDGGLHRQLCGKDFEDENELMNHIDASHQEVLTLLESLNDPANNDKLAFPSLQSLYGRNSMEELFDSSNKPSLVFLRSIRSFIGDLVYEHFGNS